MATSGYGSVQEQDVQSQQVVEVHSASPGPQPQVRVPVSARPQDRGAQVPSDAHSAPLLMPWHCSSVSVAAPPVVTEALAAADPPAPVAALLVVDVVDVTSVALAPPAPVLAVTPLTALAVPETVAPAVVAPTPLLDVTALVAVGVPAAVVAGDVVAGDVVALPATIEVWLALPSGGRGGSSELQPAIAAKPAAPSHVMVMRALAALTFMIASWPSRAWPPARLGAVKPVREGECR